MPFNFQDTYVNPNVQIKGEEIPLEQLEKTSNVIQGRYDTSMDNETKIGAITKKLLASSNPVDHETAKQIMENSKNRLAERAKAGNYQDMVWQTQQDAMDVASMYESLANRNKQIADYEKMIDLNPNNSPEIKEFQKNLYRKSIKNSTFNPENNVLEGLDVSAPNIVNSVEYGKWAMDNAGQWKPDTFGGKNVKTISTTPGQKLPDGTISNGGLYKIIGNHVTEKVSKKEILEGLNKMAGSNPALQASLNQDRQVYGDEITYKKFNDALNAAADAHAYTRQLANEDSVIFDEQSTQNKSGAGKTPIQPEGFTQLPSTIFKNNSGENLFKLDSNGNILKTELTNKVSDNKLPFGPEGGWVDSARKIVIEKNSEIENSVEYKRLKEHLTKLGAIAPGASKTDVNKAIVNFWNNEIADAESSISMAIPGNKAANDYFEQVNRTYFGNVTPDVPAKGSSILNGQLANSTFTNEKGQKLSPKELASEIKNRNVRVTGLVSQYQSPFEYGSHYMVAIDPESNEEKHYLIEPDLNTKNTGAYFANRIINSTKQKNLVSKWSDGYGVQYEATPLNGGKEYVIYLNNDSKVPIVLNNQELQILSQYPEGEASRILNGIYQSKVKQ